jgi:hypothetical protein
MRNVNTDGGQMISVTLKKTAGKTQIESCGNLLVYVQQKKICEKIDFTLIPVTLAEKSKNAGRIKLDSLTYEKMMRFTDNARNLFRQYNEGVDEYNFINTKSNENDSLKFIPIKFDLWKQISNFAPQK